MDPRCGGDSLGPQTLRGPPLLRPLRQANVHGYGLWAPLLSSRTREAPGSTALLPAGESTDKGSEGSTGGSKEAGRGRQPGLPLLGDPGGHFTNPGLVFSSAKWGDRETSSGNHQKAPDLPSSAQQRTLSKELTACMGCAREGPAERAHGLSRMHTCAQCTEHSAHTSPSPPALHPLPRIAYPRLPSSSLRPPPIAPQPTAATNSRRIVSPGTPQALSCPGLTTQPWEQPSSPHWALSAPDAHWCSALGHGAGREATS